MGHDLSLESRIRQSQLSRACYVPKDRLDHPLLEGMVEAGLLLAPMPRMYARTEYWEGLTEVERALHCMRSLQRMHQHWVFASVSAALAWGLDVPEEWVWPIRLATTRGNSGHGTETLLRQMVENDVPCVANHLRVTSLGRTALDCLRELDFEDALVLADSVLEVGAMTAEELVAQLDSCRNTSRNSFRAMEIAGYAKNVGRQLAPVHARMVSLGYEVPEQLDEAWIGLEKEELEAVLDAAGVPRVPGGFALKCPDPWRPSTLNR